MQLNDLRVILIGRVSIRNAARMEVNEVKEEEEGEERKYPTRVTGYRVEAEFRSAAMREQAGNSTEPDCRLSIAISLNFNLCRINPRLA
jgi:hypothetical protein